MPTQPAEETRGPSSARRRITLRRGNYGGTGLSQSTQAQGMRETDEEHDEVDAAIDPEAQRGSGPAAYTRNAQQLNSAVRERATIDADTGLPDESGAPAPINPRARLDEVALAGSAAYAKEYRLTLLHRLLMRRVPIDQIARQLNVSISTVEKDRAALKVRLREIAKEQDINEIVGRNIEIYDEIRGMSLRIASGGEQRNADGTAAPVTPIAMKLAALRTGLAATNDSNRMLSAAGVFDALRFRASETASGQTDMQRLMAGADDLLRALEEDDDAQGPASAPAPVKRVIRRKQAAFPAMDFADPSSDTAAQEYVEL